VIDERAGADSRQPPTGEFAMKRAKGGGKLHTVPMRRPPTALLPGWLSLGPLGRTGEAYELRLRSRRPFAKSLPQAIEHAPDRRA
jgi:hypothetical protein